MSIVRVSNLRKKYPSFDLACPYTETMQPSKTHWLFNRQYLKLFNLDENKSAIQLSEGMKVKCNLLFALSHGAEALILDEPTSGLDPFSRDELLELFETIKSEGVAIFNPLIAGALCYMGLTSLSYIKSCCSFERIDL